jgi:subtilisin family serine protease
VLPHNKIDDLIDNSTNQIFDVVVNYKSCPTASDIALLDGPSANRIELQLTYLSTITATGLTKVDISQIAAQPNVAFIEQELGFSGRLTTSVPSICVTPGSASCPGSARGLGFDGTGVNIAIIDTGVDTTHAAFALTPLVGAYNAINNMFGFANQGDDVGHGTHVASIALGQTTVNEGQGVAPHAGLIAVKVLDLVTDATCAPVSWPRIADGLQRVYDQRTAWNVGVINLSLGQWNPVSGAVISDGTDAFSELVNLAESMAWSWWHPLAMKVRVTLALPRQRAHPER